MKAPSTYGKNLFNSVKVKLPKRNTFDLSHSHKTTASFGRLLPIDVIDCGPGEVHQLGNEVLVRAQPMVFPLIDRINVFTHTYFVPYRILWDNWDEFISDQKIAGESPVIPTMVMDASVPNLAQKLFDYMGIPPSNEVPGATDAEVVNAFAMAAYQKIFADHYRDQQLQAEPDWKLVDGDNSANADLYEMRLRNLEHDLFTSARTDAQYGEQVDIPLGVVQLDPDWFGQASPHFVDQTGAINAGTVNNLATGTIEVDTGGVGPFPQEAFDPDGSLVVGPTGVNALAAAIRIQRLLERFNVAGNRYIEVIKANYGVEAQDARLQRPEYITGTKLPIVISQVLSTADSNDQPLGSMGGHGIAAGAGYTGTYFTREHGMIMTIMSIMPRTTYGHGIPKHYLYRLWTDFPWPEMAHLGEQAILQRELFAYRSTGGTTFGYTPRFAEKRYIPSRISADLRQGGLDSWHLARMFDDPPALNSTFIECDPADYDRIFAVDAANADQFIVHIVFKHVAKLPYPVYGTPMF